MWQYNHTDELYHWGVKGMKWGRRKDKQAYKSTGLKARMARKQNEKVDKSFQDWKINDEKKQNAISLGKKATLAKLAYENDRGNKDLKIEYKQANKDYQKALKENTTYRKGVVRKEVGQDAARKYLSSAKKIKKDLDADPSNKQLQKKYNDLMSKHDVERANARRATEVSTNRMNKARSIKGTITKTVTAATTTAAVGTGLYFVNKYALKGNLHVSSDKVIDLAKKGRKLFGYMY